MEIHNVALNLLPLGFTDPETRIVTLSQALSKAGIIRGEALTLIGDGFVVVLGNTPHKGNLENGILIVRLEDGSTVELDCERPVEAYPLDEERGTILLDPTGICNQYW